MTDTAVGLANAFGNLAEAMVADMKKRDEVNQLNEVLVATIPENPKRGSYYWWAQVCRENTGQHFLDSGMAYGYTYNRPVPPEDAEPLTVCIYDGNCEYVTINAIKWLENVLDGSDETAEAMEKLIYWAGLWLHPREDWGACLDAFFKTDLNVMLAHLTELQDGYRFHKKRFLKRIWHHVEFPTGYSRQRWQESLSDEEYISQATEEFPTESLKLLAQEGMITTESGFYTYNEENDLSQDIVITIVHTEWEQYAVVRTHNGCDARGGFSSPVVARVYDEGYLYDWQCDFYCTECHTSYESAYWYSKSFGKHSTVNGAVKDALDVDDWKHALAAYDAIQSGQSELPGVEPFEWKLQVSPDHARSIVKFLEENDDAEMPGVLLELDGKFSLPEMDGYSYVGADVAVLLCPECGKYSVRPSNSGAYGF